MASPRRRRTRLGAGAADHEHEARAAAGRAGDEARIALSFVQEGNCEGALRALIDSEVSQATAKREAGYAGLLPHVRKGLLSKSAHLVEGAFARVVGACACPVDRSRFTRVR